jgi:hypothetical protein
MDKQLRELLLFEVVVVLFLVVIFPVVVEFLVVVVILFSVDIVSGKMDVFDRDITFKGGDPLSLLPP